jgi:molybdopterin synthase sulfur carrier subunit
MIVLFPSLPAGGNFQQMPSATATTVTFRVLLFASYAETLRLDSIDLTLESPATVADALERLRVLPGGDKLPPKPLCALNLSQVSSNTPLSGGDELAILPPLAGG